MDDILVAGENMDMSKTLADITKELEPKGLKVAPEKV